LITAVVILFDDSFVAEKSPTPAAAPATPPQPIRKKGGLVALQLCCVHAIYWFTDALIAGAGPGTPPTPQTKGWMFK
jgi:hypothetical protein